MSYLRHTFKILDDSTPNAGDVDGSPHSVIPSDMDDISDAEQEWVALISSSQSGGATSPKTNVSIETSFDGGNTWFGVGKSTELTDDGELQEFVELKAIGPWVRATKKLGGDTKPNSTAVVLLASNGLFRARGEGQ